MLKINSLKRCFIPISVTAFQLIAILWTSVVFSYPVKFTDASGKKLCIEERPSRVVSLVPSITEIIMGIGAGDTLKAITYHSAYQPETAHKGIIGGFFSPNLNRVEEIEPDVIFCSDMQREVTERFNKSRCQLVNLETDSLADSYRNILLLGRIFNAEDKAEGLVHKVRSKLELIAKKVERIPQNRRKRVIRLMGLDPVMTPGDNSFQNEMINAAGGIPPHLNKRGQVVPMTREEWINLNPQVIYGCGGYRKTLVSFFNQPGWKDVEAVKTGKIFDFPCDLTCRAATNTGDFVSWLSARIYEEDFSKQEEQIIKDSITGSQRLDIPFNYVKDVRIVYSSIMDFPNKTLIIDFKGPLSVVSTLEGLRSGIESVGNHYSPPPCWGIGHKLGLKKMRRRIYQVINKSEDTASFLFTGADMDNLAIKRQSFRDMEVYALVTAGVKSNAVRMSADEGRFYEPGTINIILLPNMKLTLRAMARAIISATEAKTAALMDLDIRSSYSSSMHRATGTGTDNIIVVRGTGIEIDNAGGNSKLGELIAKVVYKAVQEAIYKQNGIVAQRNIFQRLKERKISLFELINSAQLVGMDYGKLVGTLEDILLKPRYASFIKASFALSDDYEKELMTDLRAYDLWCKQVAEEIAGKKITVMKDILQAENIPLVIRMALNTIFNGLYYKTN